MHIDKFYLGYWLPHFFFFASLKAKEAHPSCVTNIRSWLVVWKHPDDCLHKSARHRVPLGFRTGPGRVRMRRVRDEEYIWKNAFRVMSSDYLLRPYGMIWSGRSYIFCPDFSLFCFFCRLIETENRRRQKWQ